MMTRRVMSHRIKPAKKRVDAKRASARTFKVVHHFHNETQMINPSSPDELLVLVITVYHFFTGHSDVVLLGMGF